MKNRKNRVLAGLAGSALVAGALVGLSGGAATAVTGPAKFNCDVPMFGKSMEYPTTAEITAVAAGAGKATISLKLGAMPGIVPVAVPTPVPVKGVAAATVNGTAVTLTGEGNADLSERLAPIAAPTLTGSANVSGGSATVAVSKIDFSATAMGMTVDVACVAESGMTQTVPVTGEVAVAKVAPKVKITAKANKKRVATVKVTVNGAQGKATGKVQVTVKKGKKTVKKATVSLKGGKATVKTKKLAKGKYTVTTSYKGSNAYKTASKKVTFKVK